MLAGPTAVGKTDLAIEVAKAFKTVIVSADSRQVFMEMTVGTAVPEKAQLNQVEHFMIQNHSVTENYNASRYEFEVLALLKKLFQKNDIVIFTGGSGLYINSVLYGIDDLPTILPEIRAQWENYFNKNGLDSLQNKLKEIDFGYYQEVDLQNPKRILKALEVYTQTGKVYSSFLTKTVKKRPFEIIKITLDRDREELYDRINQRVLLMVKNGLVEEVKALLAYRQNTPLKTVGYREIFDYLDNKTTLDEAIDLIQRNTRKYARKQITWFRREKEMKWFHPDQKQDVIEFINQQISKNDI